MIRPVLLVLALLAPLALAQPTRYYLQGTTSGNLDVFFTNPTQLRLNIALGGGVERLAGPFGLQGGATLGIQPDQEAEVGLSAGALFNFGGSGPSPEAGLGFTVLLGGGQQARFGLYGVAGLEAALNRSVSLVAHFRPVLLFTPTTTFGIGLNVGLRVYP